MEFENHAATGDISDTEDGLDFDLHGADFDELVLGGESVYSSDSEESSDDNGSWIDVTEHDSNPIQNIKFSIGEKTIGPQILDISNPVQFFKLYFTDELVAEIVRETNTYARNALSSKVLSKSSIWHTWRDTTEAEFWAFLGVVVNMSVIQLSTMTDYWATNIHSRIPFFSNVFTRNRFTQIFWMLHTINPQETDIKTRVKRVSTFMDHINSKFSQYFVPNQNICIVESVVRLRGKISFITYNPDLPTKSGIRIYALVDSETGYVFSILPYYGKFTSDLARPELPLNERIPIHLLSNLLAKVPDAQGYHMHTDRYYTSTQLAEELLKMKCHLTGIIRNNRKGMPNSMKKPKFVAKKMVAFKKNNTMLLACKGKRIPTMLSTFEAGTLLTRLRFLRGGEELNFDKPKIFVNYTTAMCSVDRIDKYAASYCFLTKTLKWWRKMFFWGMEMCTLNSYILYKSVKKQKNEKPLSHSKYVQQLVDELVGDFRVDRSRPSTSTTSELRLNKKLHVMRKGTKRDCIVCSKRKGNGKRRETNLYCDTCPNKPRMHMGNCFERYHTKSNYKKK